MKAVFLDRDGTIIEDLEFVISAEQIKLIPNAVEGLANLQKAGFLLIVVSNQSAVARGMCSEDDVVEINAALAAILMQKGVRISKFYYCPHLPEGIIPIYSINCECRKPKSGMLEIARDEFKIEMAQSFAVGDSERDIQSGRAAGAKTVLLMTGKGAVYKDNRLPMPRVDIVAEDLLDASNKIAQ